MRPNIVFIVADDLGYADLSCCGRRDFSTPNIDRIAERGLRFTQAYANSAVCSATRLALITGRYQYRLPLGLEEPLAGKTDVGLPPSFGPRQSGYDRFWGILSGAVDYYTHINSRGEPDLWDGDEAASAAGYLTDLLGDRAVETVDRHARSGQRFLLSLHFNAPHWPWEAPGDEAEAERLRGTRLRHHDGGTQRTYARMVQAMDLQIGRVLQALDATGLAHDTIVIFTSDMAASGFPTPGHSPGSRPNCWRAGCACPHWCA